MHNSLTEHAHMYAHDIACIVTKLRLESCLTAMQQAALKVAIHPYLCSLPAPMQAHQLFMMITKPEPWMYYY